MSELKIYNPSEALLVLRKCTTIELCLTSETPSLSIIKKEIGENKVLAILSAWIVDINEFYNVQQKMKPSQIKETALFLMDDFYYFKIADINYIFTKAKKGRYGPLYGSIDGAKIYGWFEQHDVERANECYRENLRKHDLVKQSEGKPDSVNDKSKGVPMPKEMSERINKIGKENKK